MSGWRTSKHTFSLENFPYLEYGNFNTFIARVNFVQFLFSSFDHLKSISKCRINSFSLLSLLYLLSMYYCLLLHYCSSFVMMVFLPLSHYFQLRKISYSYNKNPMPYFLTIKSLKICILVPKSVLKMTYKITLTPQGTSLVSFSYAMPAILDFMLIYQYPLLGLTWGCLYLPFPKQDLFHTCLIQYTSCHFTSLLHTLP